MLIFHIKVPFSWFSVETARWLALASVKLTFDSLHLYCYFCVRFEAVSDTFPSEKQ